MCGQLEDKSLRSVWSAWQALLGIAGLAVVPQVLWQTFTSSSSMLPGAIAGAVGVGLAIAAQLMQLPEPLVRFRAALGACTATLLFMLQPVAQLAVNFTNPASLQVRCHCALHSYFQWNFSTYNIVTCPMYCNCFFIDIVFSVSGIWLLDHLSIAGCAPPCMVISASVI